MNVTETLNPASLCSTGARLDPVRPHSVLREGDHRRDPARRGPQRPRVVWSCGAAGLSAGSRHHVSSGQRVQLLFIRRPLQHKVSLNATRKETGGRYRKDTSLSCGYSKEEAY